MVYIPLQLYLIMSRHLYFIWLKHVLLQLFHRLHLIMQQKTLCMQFWFVFFHLLIDFIQIYFIQTNRKFVCIPRFYYLIPLVKGILPSRAFLILLNTLINPKVSIYIRQESHDKSSRRGSISPPPYGNQSNETHHHIPRKRSHASACE